MADRERRSNAPARARRDYSARVAIPDFQTLMRPLLAPLEKDGESSTRAVREILADRFGLTADEREERLPSGRARTFDNRVGWALSHMYQAMVVDRPRRAVYRLTNRGRQVLADHPGRVDLSVLATFPEYRA